MMAATETYSYYIRFPNLLRVDAATVVSENIKGKKS